MLVMMGMWLFEQRLGQQKQPDPPNERVAVLETKMDALAKREDITALGGKLDAYAKGVDGVERRVGSIENQIPGILAALKVVGERLDRVEKTP